MCVCTHMSHDLRIPKLFLINQIPVVVGLLTILRPKRSVDNI